MLVSAGGGVSRLDTDLGAIGRVTYAEFSPDRTLIALRGDRGFLVVNADDGRAILTSNIRGEDADMAWSSDSRFVFFPDFRGRGVVVVDLESGSIDTVLHDKPVVAVGVIPLSHS
ncbi:MAG: hypothetical protein ACRDVL_03145 [Acidimicrobiia bacterium]